MAQSLSELAASAIDHTLLRHVAQNETLDVVMSVAAVCAKNVRVQGRCSNAHANFSATVEHWPKVSIGSLEQLDFWFELDTETPTASSGRLCCSTAEALSSEQVERLAFNIRHDLRYELLPRRGSCWLSLMQENSRKTNRYRFDCLVHMSNWLEIVVEE